MKYAELFLFEAELNKLSGKQLPISLELAKNLKKVKKLKEDYFKKLEELNEKYAIKNEKGEYIDKDGNPTTDSLKMKMTDSEAFGEAFKELLSLDVELELVTVKGSKKMYDSESKTDIEITKYLSKVLTGNELLFLDTYGLVEDILE